MTNQSASWVWFLDQETADKLLGVEPATEGMAREGMTGRAAAHPSVVEAVRLQAIGNPAGAIEALAPALVLDNPDALWLAGQLSFERGQFSESAAYYGRLAGKQPGHPFASFNQGVAFGKAQDFAAALEP